MARTDSCELILGGRLALPRVALVLVLLLVVAGCGLSEHVIIDYVDFVQHDGIRYLVPFGNVGRPLTEADLGPALFTVKRSLEELQQQGTHVLPQDDDAAFLSPGTPVYTVLGYPATFRLAAHHDNRLLLYEANSNPNAHTGADLLPIGGKVSAIRLLSPGDGTTVLATIADPHEVERLVALVLAAPVNQATSDTERMRYLLAFDLRDGTAVARAYWRDSGELAYGILTPPAFGAALDQAASAQQATPRATSGATPAATSATTPGATP